MKQQQSWHDHRGHVPSSDEEDIPNGDGIYSKEKK